MYAVRSGGVSSLCFDLGHSEVVVGNGAPHEPVDLVTHRNLAGYPYVLPPVQADEVCVASSPACANDGVQVRCFCIKLGAIMQLRLVPLASSPPKGLSNVPFACKHFRGKRLSFGPVFLVDFDPH